jgi:hypothetical protein
MKLASWAGVAAFVLICAVQHVNADDAGCNKFAWALTHEKTLFAAADKRRAEAGAELTSFPAAAVVLDLKPAAQAAFVLPPERKPRTETWFGGMLRLPAPEAGSYQVTLSEEAWIDVVQDGRYARSIGSTGRSDCSGLRKSVRFELGNSPFIVQLSGVAAEIITLTIRRSE